MPIINTGRGYKPVLLLRKADAATDRQLIRGSRAKGRRLHDSYRSRHEALEKRTT